MQALTFSLIWLVHFHLILLPAKEFQTSIGPSAASNRRCPRTRGKISTLPWSSTDSEIYFGRSGVDVWISAGSWEEEWRIPA